MAVSHPLLSSQLVSKLNNHNEELEERFKVAELVFSSSTIPIIRKEEIVIEWLANKINEIGCEGSAVPYDVLNKCVAGPRLQNVTLEVRRNVVASLIEALTQQINNECYEVEESRKKCILAILSSSYFLNIFYRDVSSFSKLVKEYCSISLKMGANSLELKRVGEITSKFSKQCLLHEDLQLSFIREMMIPLCQTLSTITDDYEPCEKEIYDCMEQILSRESNLTEKFIDLYRSKKNPEGDSFTAKLIIILKKLPSKHSVNLVKIIYTLFLKAIFNSNSENHSMVFKIFTLLCTSLGIKVKGMISIDTKPLKNWSMKDSFTVISSMLQLLDSMKLSIDCSLDNDITLQVWFTSMIIGLAGINSSNLSQELLKMITSIFKLNPLVIESSHKHIVTIIMLSKKNEDNQKEYIHLLKTMLDGSLKVSRFQKFITRLLETVEEHLQFADNIQYSVEDVFPKEITEHFCNTVSMMPGSQVLSTVKSLQYHIHYICSNKLEASNVGDNILLCTEICTHLLIMFLNGVKIADFNTPTIVKDKFSGIVAEVGETLKLFTEIILDRESNDRLLNCLLKILHSVGTSILLLWEYDRDERRPLEDIDNIPTNLSFVHSYIDADMWDQIEKRVIDSESDVVKNNYYMLIMQKMTAVSQIEEGANGPGTLAARYLLANANSSWHWDNATALAPLLQDNELLGLLEGLIKSAGLDHTKWIPFVSSDYFSRNKRLVVAACTGLLLAMSKHIHKNRKNGAVSHRVMSKVAVVPLLEYELSRLFEDNEELECDIRFFFEEMIAELETYLLEDPPPASSNEDFSIGGFIKIITKINYEDCSYAMEVCMLVAVISFLCDIPIGTNDDHLLLEKLNVFLQEPRISSPAFLLNLHSGALLRFLVKRTEGFPDQRQLIQRFCNFSATSAYTSHILIKYVKSPSLSTLWQTSAVIKALALHRKDGEMESTKVKSLMKLLHATVPLLEKEEPSIELLSDYYISIDQVIKLNDQTMLAKLLRKFKKYLTLSISKFDKGEQLIKLALKRNESLSSEYPDSFQMDLWHKVLKEQDIEEYDKILRMYCCCLSCEEIKVILSDLHHILEEGMTETPFSKDKIKRCFFLWKGVIWAEMGVLQKKEISEALTLFMTPLMELVSSWSHDKDPIVVPVLDFFSEIAQSPCLNTFGSHLLDTYFTILRATPLEGPNTLENLNAGLEALVAIFMFRRTLVVDRLPPFLQIFRLYAKVLGSISSPDLDETVLLKTESCADKLARSAEIMVKNKKDFVRVAPYIVSDLLKIFETSTMHQDIKVHFVNTLSSFFSVMDDHGQAFLASALSPAGQELYKTYFDQYNRYYKYHGKI